MAKAWAGAVSLVSTVAVAVTLDPTEGEVTLDLIEAEEDLTSIKIMTRIQKALVRVKIRMTWASIKTEVDLDRMKAKVGQVSHPA